MTYIAIIVTAILITEIIQTIKQGDILSKIDDATAAFEDYVIDVKGKLATLTTTIDDLKAHIDTTSDEKAAALLAKVTAAKADLDGTANAAPTTA